MQQNGQAVKSADAIPGRRVALPSAIQGQVIDLIADHLAAARVVPHALLPLTTFMKMNSMATIMGLSIPVRDDSAQCFF
jgi:hypothetical protein